MERIFEKPRRQKHTFKTSTLSLYKTILLFFLSLTPLMGQSKNHIGSNQPAGYFNPKIRLAQEDSSSIFGTIKRIQIRQERKEDKQRLSKKYPHYKACWDMPEQPLPWGEEAKIKTEAGFCASCRPGEDSQKQEIQKASLSLSQADFKETLKKRVQSLIELKIFQIQALRSCLKKDYSWFKKKADFNKVDYPIMKGLCEKKIAKLKPSIQKGWSDMRVSLALSSPAIKADQVLPHTPSTWMDKTPSHIISDFSSLPPLSAEEKKKAKKQYKEALSTALLEEDKAENKEALQKISLEGQAFQKPEDKKEFLSSLFLGTTVHRYFPHSSSFKRKLKQAEIALQKNSEDHYYKIIKAQPILGYLEKSPLNEKELDKAFGKMQESLKNYLGKIKDPEVDMGLLMSFEPLVKALLEEDKGESDSSKYCLAAELARLQVEKDSKFEDNLFFAGIFVVLAPCFMGGPVSLAVCLAGDMTLNAWDMKKNDKKVQNALIRVVAEKDFSLRSDVTAIRELEKLDDLKEKNKNFQLARLAFSLVFLEVAGVSKAAQKFRKTRKKK